MQASPADGHMRAITYDRYGGPEVLTLREIPDPEYGPEDVLIDVHATAMAYTASYLTGQVDGREYSGGDFVAESSRRARGFAGIADRDLRLVIIRP